MKKLLTVIVIFAGIAAISTTSGASEIEYGYGSAATGGAGGATYHVTTLADSGPGSLRDAVTVGNRTIVFDVAGTITLSSDISIRVPNITLDGGTAPGPVILYGATLEVYKTSNIIIKNIKVDNPAANCDDACDSLRLWHVQNALITHNTFDHAGDGALDITGDSHDITVSWNIIGNTDLNSLINTADGLNPKRITIHHNVYYKGGERNPNVKNSTDVDLINNIIYAWSDSGGYGTSYREGGAKGNIIGNYYIATSRPHATFYFDSTTGGLYISGFRATDAYPNVAPTEGWDKLRTTWSSLMLNTAYDRPYVPILTTAQEAAIAVVTAAGPSKKSTVDTSYLSAVSAVLRITPTAVPSTTPTGTPTQSPTLSPTTTPTATYTLIPATSQPVPPHCTSLGNLGLREGQIISSHKVDGDVDVFIVNDWCYKRLFINEAIFSLYGHLHFRDIVPVAPATRDYFQTSGIFRNCSTGDPKVYALEVIASDVGVLHWINISGAEAVRQNPNFFHMVFCINDGEYKLYPHSGEAYTSLSQIPNYSRK